MKASQKQTIFLNTYKFLKQYFKEKPDTPLTLDSFKAFIVDSKNKNIPVVFSPPQDFVCLTTVCNFEFDDEGFIDAVSSKGDKVFYVLDDELTKLLLTKTPSFVF